MKTSKQLVDEMYFAHQDVIRAEVTLAELGDDTLYYNSRSNKLDAAEKRFDAAVKAVRARLSELDEKVQNNA